jgi:predicted NAD/FAD-binding protein
MHRYVEAFRSWFVAHGGELHCGSRVLGVVRRRGGVEIRAVDEHDRHRSFYVSQVVLACNAHEALPLLELSTVQERDLLAAFPFQRARVVLHRDPAVLGHDERAWGAFNYVVPGADLPRVRPTITFFPNRLAGLPASAPDVFVTMTPHREPAPDAVLAQRFFLHPVAGAANDAAAARLERLQGRRRTWFAGSYLRNPFVHESAFTSGIDAAERLIRAERGRRTRTARERVA